LVASVRDFLNHLQLVRKYYHVFGQQANRVFCSLQAVRSIISKKVAFSFRRRTSTTLAPTISTRPRSLELLATRYGAYCLLMCSFPVVKDVLYNYIHRRYLRQGGYVFAVVYLSVCRITQKSWE